MKMLTGLALFVASSSVSAAASFDELLDRAATAGKQHDVAAWMALYCQAGPASNADKHTIKNFTRAYLDEPSLHKRKGVVKELMMCSETMTSKEVCLIVPVTERSGSLCLKRGR